jgi:hypothetical protein
MTKKATYVTPDSTYLVSYPPHHPGVKVVTESYANGYFRTYQISSTGLLSHCVDSEEMTLSMSLPDEFIFYPVGDEGSLRRFKITFYSELAAQYFTMEYYDDAATFLPKMMISPSSEILLVDKMEVGLEKMRAFESLGINITSSQFQSCSRRYQDQLKAVEPNTEPIDNIVNASISLDEIGFSNSTNSSTSRYPPDASLPPMGMKVETIIYYSSLLELDNPDDPTLPGDFSSEIAPWVEWYLDVFRPNFVDMSHRKLAEEKNSNYQTSVLEYYMSELDQYGKCLRFSFLSSSSHLLLLPLITLLTEVEQLSRKLWLEEFPDDIARNISILRVLAPNSFVFHEEYSEETSRKLLLNLCSATKNGVLSYCRTELSIIFKAAYSVKSFNFDMSIETGRESLDTVNWITTANGQVTGCSSLIFCGTGKITTTKGKVSGCLVFSIDLGTLPLLQFLTSVIDLNFDILTVCYNWEKKSEVDELWWPGNKVVHRNVHSATATVSTQLLYLKWEVTSGVTLYTFNDSMSCPFLYLSLSHIVFFASVYTRKEIL